jgi:hypothetical protein
MASIAKLKGWSVGAAPVFRFAHATIAMNSYEHGGGVATIWSYLRRKHPRRRLDRWRGAEIP